MQMKTPDGLGGVIDHSLKHGHDRGINLVTDGGLPSHQQRYEHHREAAHAPPSMNHPEGKFYKARPPLRKVQSVATHRVGSVFGET